MTCPALLCETSGATNSQTGACVEQQHGAAGEPNRQHRLRFAGRRRSLALALLLLRHIEQKNKSGERKKKAKSEKRRRRSFCTNAGAACRCASQIEPRRARADFAVRADDTKMAAHAVWHQHARAVPQHGPPIGSATPSPNKRRTTRACPLERLPLTRSAASVWSAAATMSIHATHVGFCWPPASVCW